MLTNDELNMLRELKAKSTQVNGWYHYSVGDGYHPGFASVRGPYHRWFLVQAGDDQGHGGLASQDDDAKFAAAAMNNLPQLVDDVVTLKNGLLFVRSELLAGHGTEDIAACVCWRCALRRTYIDPALGEDTTAKAKKSLHSQHEDCDPTNAECDELGCHK